MAVQAVNLRMHRGTDFSHTFTIYNPDYSPRDLNGYKVTAKVVKWPGSKSGRSFLAYVSNFDEGQITIKMTDFNTALLRQGRHYYDVIIDDGSTYGIEKVVEGMIMVEETAGIAPEAPIPPDKQDEMRLEDLSNVSIVGIQSNYVLIYDGVRDIWQAQDGENVLINAAVPGPLPTEFTDAIKGAGIGTTARLQDLSDAITAGTGTGIGTDYVIQWDEQALVWRAHPSANVLSAAGTEGLPDDFVEELDKIGVGSDLNGGNWDTP